LLFNNHNISFEKINLNGNFVWVFEYRDNHCVIEYGSQSINEAREWIINQIPYISQYLTFNDFNQEFWEDVGLDYVLYHATPEENIKSIKKQGLNPQYKTRGISNRTTGDAVFLSSSIDSIEIYGIPIGVKIGLMKKDGYMPRVSLEEPVEEKKAYELLAWKLGIRDFYYEIESGIDEETVIMYGHIPSKYLMFNL
jgi:hypothetical protein